LTSLDVIRDELQLERVTLNIDIVIADTDATVAKLLALYVWSQSGPDPTRCLGEP
jgi:hypothetical protein